jgi:hypothetical protein
MWILRASEQRIERKGNKMQNHKKPLIDLTQNDDDWRLNMEENIARLEAMITRVLMQGGHKA